MSVSKKQKTGTAQVFLAAVAARTFANEFEQRQKAVAGTLAHSSRAYLANLLKVFAKATFVRVSFDPSLKLPDGETPFLHMEAEIGQSVVLCRFGLSDVFNVGRAKISTDVSNLSFAKLPAVVLSNLKSEQKALVFHLDKSGLVFQTINDRGQTQMFF